MVRDEVCTYAEVAQVLNPDIVVAIERALGWPLSHGTLASYRREWLRGEVPCPTCLEVARREGIRRRSVTL